MIQVTFTAQETQALGQLLDLATKAGGLQVAGAALTIQNKLIEAVQAAQEPVEINPND